jgi:CRP/FNR family transcriptional regulator, cyclic AMP receptor protein
MKPNILLIEDNEPIRENTAELLELSNYKVMTACNGRDGFDVAIKYIPDLILCDVVMPEMDGYQFYECIKKHPPLNKTRFIFITALNEKKDIDRAIKMGVADYIIKPFTGEYLLEVLRKNLV